MDSAISWLNSHPARRRRLVLVASILFLAAGFAARVAFSHSASDGVMALYVLPVALVALEWGPVMGLATAALALGLFATWVQIDDVDVDALGYLSRAGASFPLAVLVGIWGRRLRAVQLEGSRAEDRHRTILETANEAFIASDRQGMIREWNLAAERTFGWSASETIGQKLLPDTVVPEGMREGYWQGLRAYHETGEQTMLGERVEIKALRKDAREIPIELSMWDSGEGDEWISYGFMHDISERKESEAALRRLSGIVESSHDAIYSYTLDGEITSWNEAAEQLFGYTAEEAIRMSLSDLVPPDRPDDAAAALERVRKGETSEDRESVRMGKAGRRLEVSLAVSPITDPDGKIIGAATIARDISDRKRTWRYLSAQYRATRVLADAPEIDEIGTRVLPILCDSGRWTCGAYWAATEESSELRCEATWVAPHLRAPILPVQDGATWKPRLGGGADPLGEPVWVTGVEPDSPVPCAEHAALGSLTTALWMPVQTGGKVHGAFEFFDRRGRPEDKELLSVLTAIASQMGNYVERKRAEQDADRTKTEFLGLVSHELRTPLTSIIGYTELLREIEMERLSEQGRHFLEVVERNARRELRLVGDLLLLVRIQAGSFAIEPGRANLRQIVEEAIEAARPTAERHGVDLSFEMEAVPDCEADAHRLGQVVDNLLTNAIKFSPDGGEVAVRLGRHNGTATIEVQDTGMGIPPEDREKLFERLYRAKGATAMQIPGTGLGLSIVKAIVDAHGGEVGVESEVGAGTTFCVELPLDAAGGNGSKPAKDAPE